MSIYDRLCGRDETGGNSENINKISIDQFASLITENIYGTVTRKNIIDIYALNAAEKTELDVILNKGGTNAEKREMALRLRGILHLAEGNVVGYGLPSQLAAQFASI